MLKKFSVFRDLNKFIFFHKNLEICVEPIFKTSTLIRVDLETISIEYPAV